MPESSAAPLRLEAVAKRARVSTATVSRVLNNVGSVKSATRQRVLKAAKDLNYQPNMHARMLARGSTRTLGMIVSNLDNPFFLDVFRAAESGAHAKGFELVVANTGYEAEQLMKSVRLMIARRVAGLAIIVSETDDEITDELARNQIPVVLYDAVPANHNKMSIVRVDYATGIRTAVKYLFEVGHRRMAFVSHHATLGPLSIREKAFRETVEAFAPAVSWTSRSGVDGLEGGRLAAQGILDSGFHPTAIVCVNDLMAFGVIRAIRERGLKVPDDISVTGFDNIKLAEYCYPMLTTLHIPRDRIGQMAAESLLADIESKDRQTRDMLIKPEFVLRESTGHAPHKS